ncbi:MAG: branched-chain amino acid ABC transporter permease [Chloroflexi bacterium]|nr:branched-chain amino acid ABC transporter permease [Chloroflexota bacterium]
MDPVITLIQLIISGALVGGIYGLIAMGFVVAYRNARVFNIAYGQLAVVGAFVAWTFVGSPAAPRLPVPFAVVATLAVAVLLGLVVEWLLFRRMIDRSQFATFVASLGLLGVLQGLVMSVWGTKTLAMAPVFPKGPLHLGGIVLAREYLWAFLVAVLLAFVITLFFRRTRLGLAMRAAYDNQAAARTLGVSVRLSSQVAWSISAVIAAAGGILIATVGGVSMALSELVLVVLAVVLIAGMDSVAGCIAGGLVLAVGQNLVSYYAGAYFTGIESVFSMVLILIVLLVRPSGMFGTKPIERV